MPSTPTKPDRIPSPGCLALRGVVVRELHPAQLRGVCDRDLPGQLLVPRPGRQLLQGHRHAPQGRRGPASGHRRSRMKEVCGEAKGGCGGRATGERKRGGRVEGRERRERRERRKLRWPLESGLWPLWGERANQAAAYPGDRVTATTGASRRLVSITETAEILGISPKTVRRRIATGDLAAVRLGRRTIRIRTESIDKMIDAHSVTPWALRKWQ
ncbi:helix-turn-helix domain-containing protein [Nocardioides endophyticus]|uniref:helix-turn-helix domain-containing protein n=1 Tax=Nocardioides endophyticus TaxID=1353775 RepID=UPI0031F07EBC